MQTRAKYISALDLKYLDTKFRPIKNSDLDISTNLQQIRRSKLTQFPSILKSIHRASTIQTTFGHLSTDMSCLDTPLPDLSQYRNKKNDLSKSILHTEKKQIQKYRGYVSRLKSDNELLQKQITNILLQKQLLSAEPKVKEVRTILQSGKGIVSYRSAENLHKKHPHKNVSLISADIYEKLGNQKSPYDEKIVQLQKQFVASNLHKSFQSFLVNHNKRIPQFMKNICC